jgi:hypothetical protein
VTLSRFPTWKNYNVRVAPVLAMYGEFGGGARRVAVDFDGTYKSCTVGVTIGKQAGRTSFSQNNMRGQRLEVFSVQTGGFECSIQEGNVFAQ